MSANIKFCTVRIIYINPKFYTVNEILFLNFVLFASHLLSSQLSLWVLISPSKLWLFRRVCKIAKSDYKLRHICSSVLPSAWNNSAPIGRIFLKFDIGGVLENLLRKFKFHQNRTRTKGTLHEEQYTLFIISRSFLLRMRNVSDERCRENQNTYFVISNFFLRNSCSVRDNVEKYCRSGHATDNNMAHAHCMLNT